MNLETLLADSERVPDGFTAICPADHPKNGTSGMLARNNRTGIYVLLAGGAVMSVPHAWAVKTAADAGVGPDAIQDACIARMAALGLTAYEVAELLEGKVSASHVYDYLARRKSMGSHKLVHLLDALGLELRERISSGKS